MFAGHMQWQAADSVDHPPSNNLAGVTGHHTHSLPPTPADAAWTGLAGPRLADGRDLGGSEGWSAAALSGPALSSQVGEQLVGCQVETRSQLDSSWFTATVEVRPVRSSCLVDCQHFCLCGSWRLFVKADSKHPSLAPPLKS